MKLCDKTGELYRFLFLDRMRVGGRLKASTGIYNLRMIERAARVRCESGHCW